MDAIHGGAGAVVLADGFDDTGIVEHFSVVHHEFVGIAVGSATEPERADVIVEEPLRICADHPLRQRCRLGQETPVPIQQRELRIGSPPHLAGRNDVEGGHRGDASRVVQRRAVRDPTTSVVPDGRRTAGVRGLP